MFNKDSRRGPQELEDELYRSSIMSMTRIIHELPSTYQVQSWDHEILAQRTCQGAGTWGSRQMRQQPPGQSAQG